MKKLKDLKCKLCCKKNLEIIYEDYIRDGQWGKLSEHMFKVVYCNKCDIRYLDPFPKDRSTFYESKEYREKYTGSIEANKFYELYDEVQEERIFRIGLKNFRSKIVADFGAGGGGFLDAIAGVAKETIAIEPAQHYRTALEKKHKYYPYGQEFVATGNAIDIAVSFEVIEHVDNPLEYLLDIFKSLRKDGILFLSTVNYNNIYNDLIKQKFDRFNYRTAHQFYFTEKSIRYLLKKAGFLKIKVSYFHDYDLSNLIIWLRDGKPSGKHSIDIFSEELNKMYKSNLENQGKAMSLWIEALK